MYDASFWADPNTRVARVAGIFDYRDRLSFVVTSLDERNSAERAGWFAQPAARTVVLYNHRWGRRERVLGRHPV